MKEDNPQYVGMADAPLSLEVVTALLVEVFGGDLNADALSASGLRMDRVFVKYRSPPAGSASIIVVFSCSLSMPSS